MDLSSGGRIVVIDDVRAEVEQLLITLGRNGIPCLYFSGEIAALPMAPLTGIRFVILDIELAGMDGQDDKTKASAVAGVLEKVISKANGPFVILFWTLHGEVKEQVIEYSKAKGIIPVASVDLDKAACTNSANPVQSITEALNRELASVVAFQVYVEWENVVDQSTRQFVFDFSSLVPLGAKWSAQTAEICYRLYKSVVGKHELPTQQERFKCACHLMNRSYLDTLERFTDSQLKLPTGISITSGVLSDETTAKLNSSLFLSQPIADRRGSGYVYKVENQPLHGTLKKRLFKAESVPENTMLCGVILTPACDIAEKKTL